MQKVLAKIFTTRNLVIFPFLLFLVFGLTIPLMKAEAGGGSGEIGQSCKVDTDCKLDFVCWDVVRGTGCGYAGFANCRCNFPVDLKIPNPPDSLGDQGFGWDFFTSIFVGIGRIILWSCWRVAHWVSYLFSAIIASWVRDVSITQDPNFVPGWVTIRDLANMLIVLSIVVIGIATSLRLREYEAKKLLVPLILVALLVNFSGLFCGLLIDASNITFSFFTQGAGDSGTIMIDKIAEGGRTSVLTYEKAAGQTTTFVTNCLLYAFIYLTVAFTYLYLSLILIARYAILAMLFILSPLAFFFWVFPPTKKLWSEWWSNFLKWCFVGVIGGFFLNIAVSILSPANAGSQSNWPKLMIALIFMAIGFKMTAKQSGLASMATGAVMGLATGGAGFVAGVAMKGAKGGARMAGVGADAATGGRISGAYNNIASRTGRGLERLGLRAQGTTAQKFDKGMKETVGRISNMEEDDKKRAATGRAFTSRGIQEKVAAIQDKVKNGKLGDLGDEKQQAYLIDYADKYIKGRGGVSTIKKDAVKRNPTLAVADHGNPKSDELEVMRKAIQGQAPREFAKNLDASTFKSPLGAHVLGAMDDKQITYLANSGAKDQKDALKGLVDSKNRQVIDYADKLVREGKDSEVDTLQANYDAAKKLLSGKRTR